MAGWPWQPDIGLARQIDVRTTPERLRRQLAMIFVGIAVFWMTATIVELGLHGTVQSARGRTVPAYLAVIRAHAALSDADRAAWQSFRSGEAEFNGPGVPFQDDITNASQDFQQLAALSGGPQLQTASGQLVNYQALVEQADAAYREDTVLEAASRHELGYAYLTYASQSMRGAGGLLSTVGDLAAADRRAATGQLASSWAAGALMLTFALAGGLALWSLVRTQVFLRRKFHRRYNPPLLLATALACGLMGWGALAILPADGAFHAAGSTALPKLVRAWQAQIGDTDDEATALRAHGAGGGSAGPSGGSPVAAAPASGALDDDLAAAANTGGLPVGIPVLTVAMAALAWLGIKPRLDEYRGRP